MDKELGEKENKDNAFEKILKEPFMPSFGHSIYSIPRATLQDYAILGSLFDKEKGNDVYRRNNEAHSYGEINDNLDDGSLRHEGAKFIADNILARPLAVAMLAGANAATVGHPDLAPWARFAGNAAVNAGTGYAKSKGTGSDYGWEDAAKDVVLGMGTSLPAALNKIPNVAGYSLAGALPKVAMHASKAQAKEFEARVIDEFLKQNEEAERIEQLLSLVNEN